MRLRGVASPGRTSNERCPYCGPWAVTAMLSNCTRSTKPQVTSFLVLELVSGGELFDHVCARECLDEVEAAAFVRQILLGIKHLHSLHIVHLDIKVLFYFASFCSVDCENSSAVANSAENEFH
ncbi:hypothetical protein COOONC_06268 [Cooperia oncophora]